MTLRFCAIHLAEAGVLFTDRSAEDVSLVAESAVTDNKARNMNIKIVSPSCTSSPKYNYFVSI